MLLYYDLESSENIYFWLLNIDNVKIKISLIKITVFLRNQVFSLLKKMENLLVYKIFK